MMAVSGMSYGQTPPPPPAQTVEGITVTGIRKGIEDAYAELRGTIATQEKFDKARWRLANTVWDEMRENNSENCRTCHDPTAMDSAKQSEDAVKQHKKFAAGKATCIDCHTGVAHKEPEEPKEPAKAADASK